MGYFASRFIQAAQSVAFPNPVWAKAAHWSIAFGLALLFGVSRWEVALPVLKQLNIEWLSSISGWAFIAGGVGLLAVALAWRVAGREMQVLKCTDIRALNQNGGWAIEVEVTSNASIIDVVSYLKSIECIDPARDVAPIEFPLPIFSHERRAEQQSEVIDQPARPHNYRQGQPKWHEIVRVYKDDQIFDLNAFNRTERFVTRDWVKFGCVFYCPSGRQLDFSVVYYEYEHPPENPNSDGWPGKHQAKLNSGPKRCIILLDADGRSVRSMELLSYED